MKNALGTIFFVIYAIIAITVTVLLLSYNEYLCSEIGGYTLYMVKDDTLEPNYAKGNLLLIKQTNDANVNEGDQLLLYQNLSKNEFQIKNGKLEDRNSDGRHITYLLDDGYQFDSSYAIGKTSDTIVIPVLGLILSLLESRWGYLFCIVIGTLFLFLQELYNLFIEIKYGGDDDEDDEYEKKKAAKSVKGSK